MYCSQCGRQIDGAAAFCPYCGAAQGSVSAGHAPGQPAYPQMGQTPPPGPPPAGRPNTPPTGYSAPGYQPPAAYQNQPPPGYQPPPAAYQPPVAGPPTGYAPPPPGYQPGRYGGPAPYQAPYPSPIPAAPSRAARAAKTKTGADIVSGIVFFGFGIVAAVSFSLLLATAFSAFRVLLGGGFAFADVLAAIFDTGGLQRHALPLSLTTLGAVTGFLAGFILAIGGLASLIGGRGRGLAFSAAGLMGLTLLFDVLTLALMNHWKTLSAPLGDTLLASWLIYFFEIIFVLAALVLPAVQKSARKRRSGATPPPAAPARMSTPETDAPAADTQPDAKPAAEAPADISAPPDEAPPGDQTENREDQP